MPLVQHARQPLRIRGRVPGTDETSHDLGGRAPHRLRIERIAAEQINLFQPREQSRAGVAAGDALHLVDGQKLARVEPIRIKLGAAVKMAGNEKNVAAHTLAASRLEPIGTTALDQLDELKIVLRKIAAEYFLLVGRIDCDRAHRLLVGSRILRPDGDEQRGQQDKLRARRLREGRHGTTLAQNGR